MLNLLTEILNCIKEWLSSDVGFICLVIFIVALLFTVILSVERFK